MSSYTGFVLTDNPIDIQTWIWGSNSTPRPRFMKQVNSYLPLSTDGTQVTTTMVYVPNTVYPGPFYMKLDDLLARTGKNSSNADQAKAALNAAPSSWGSDVSAWLDDGTTVTIQHSQLTPTPGSSKSYNTNAELSLMWSLITQRIKDAYARPFNVYSRFWQPPKQSTAYQIYIVPTPAVTVDQVQDAVNQVLDALDPNSEIYKVTVVAIPPNQSGMHKVGHNFLCLYDTYMTDDEYKRMVTATYGDVSSTSSTNPWPIRPWPSFDTAGTANQKLDGAKTPKARKQRSIAAVQASTITRRTEQARVQRPKLIMNDVDANTFGQLFWPTASTLRQIMPPYNCEWLSRAGWFLGGVQQRRSLFFGTAECGTQIMRAQNSIRQFAISSGWNCRLITTPSDSAQASGTRWMWQFDSASSDHAKAPDFVNKDSTSKKPFSWAVAFLDYEFIAADPQTTQSIHVLDRFDTFNRYVPLLLEIELDKIILDTYLSSIVPTTSSATTSASSASSASAQDDESNTSNDEEKQTTSQSDYKHHYIAIGLSAPSSNFGSAALTESRSPKPDLKLTYVDDPRIHTVVAHTQALAAVAQTDSSSGSLSLTKERTTTSLFGSTLSADIYKYDGTLPSGVTPPPDNASPVYEQVTLDSLSISTIVLDLAGTPLDCFELSNIVFVYQNCLIDGTKAVGWSFDCDATIKADAGTVHDVPDTLFSTGDISVHLSANLGDDASQTWDVCLRCLSFTFIGSLNISATNLSTAVKLTSFGIRIHAYRAHVDASSPAKLQYNWDLFGSMAVTFPSSNTPLIFDYLLGESNGMVTIAGKLQGDIWDNAAGISGLKLEVVAISVEFSSGKKPSAFDIEITAELMLDASVIEIDGLLSGTDFSLSATWPSFDISDLDFLYNLLHSCHLSLPDTDIAIGNVCASITSGLLSLSFLDVTIDGRFDLPLVEIGLSLSGVQLTGVFDGTLTLLDSIKLGTTTITVALKSASIIVSLGRLGKDSFLWFQGQLDWTVYSNTLTFTVAVYLYRDSQETLQYVVYGGVSGSKSWTFGNMLGNSCPEILKKIGLESVSILFASEDQDQSTIGPITVPYQVYKGITVSAAIGAISEANKSLGKCGAGSVTDLILYVRLLEKSLTIQLPSSVTLDFGDGIKTTPITITVDTTPALIFKGGISYQPNGKGTKLTFDLILLIEAAQAEATLDCKVDWNNPLGISTNVTVKEVLLGVTVVYASGQPNDIQIGGKIQIGNATDDVILVLGDNAADWLFKVDVYELDVNDIIRFTSNLLGTTLPTIHDGTIYLKRFNLYASAGTYCAGVWYPAGFSASLQLQIFGVSASADLQVTTGSGFTCQASIDDFNFACVDVENAHLNATWSSSTKSIEADGQFKVLWWWVSIYIYISTDGISFSKDSAAKRNALAVSEHDAGPSDLHIEASLHWPLYGKHKLPVRMRKSVPPTDWQNPMAGGPGIHYIFDTEFDQALLSTVTERAKHHFEVLRTGSLDVAHTVFSDILAALSDYSSRAEDIDARRCQETLAIADRARNVKFNELEAEFLVYRDRLASLVKQQQIASEAFHTLITSLESKRATLVQQLAALPLRLERLQQNATEAFEAASAELLLQERKLRGRVGDLPGDLERISTSIATVNDEVRVVESALQNLSLIQSPWNGAMFQRLDITRNDLLGKLAVFQSAQSSIVQCQRDAVECSMPMYQAFREANAKVVEAEELVTTIASGFDAENSRLTDALYKATEQLRLAREGPAYRAFASTLRAVIDHTSTKSPNVTSAGRLINLDELPESRAWNTAYDDLCVVLDAVSCKESLGDTRQYWKSMETQERRRVGGVLGHLSQASSFSLFELHAVKLNGKLESDKTLEDLVFVADVHGRVGGYRFNHQVDFRLHKPDEFIHDLVRTILGSIV